MFCEPAYSLPSDEKEPYSSSAQKKLAKKKPRLAFDPVRGKPRHFRPGTDSAFAAGELGLEIGLGRESLSA